MCGDLTADNVDVLQISLLSVAMIHRGVIPGGSGEEGGSNDEEVCEEGRV